MTACIFKSEELHDFTDHPGIITDSVVEYLPLFKTARNCSPQGYLLVLNKDNVHGSI